MKHAFAAFVFRPAGLPVLLAASSLLLTACDSTPREREEAVRNSAREIDTVANRAGDVLKRVGSRAARWDSVSRQRNRQPLDNAATAAFNQELLGSYANVEQLTVTDLEPAYVQLLRETRAKRRTWTQRDWDYATAIFNRLNARYRAIRLDLPARNELHIKALQAEFTALETGRDLKDLGAAVKDKPADRQ
ncbi:hypothetical protein F0P96_08625 [Hymenobacter busanensis]|uniref:Uncharacterized protein n=1 Tax=Hymenobacter busanensis TaxID=2607656 RepID=A0A7L4ZZK9_9BACT|nr:hypothetical protein [Hymenobacter busanensis]KAA9333039.1 hypothetical protein F0P96_08625 [Hymenobacter busanensis]QHJ08286.1 hypothetical protein GUY19_13700 [Hymenobacter busanensis]